MFWLVILLCFCFGNCIEVNQSEDKLIFAQILFRHGARTLRKTYRNDPYKNAEFWPEGFGQLTNIGKQRQFELGKYLYQRYEKFIGTYSPDKVSVVSSDYDRTINSANLVLAALFPPKGNQIWNEDIPWLPVAVHTLPEQMDYILDAESACARYAKLFNEYYNSPAINALIEQHRELFEYLELHSGQPIRNLVHIRDLHETLDIEQQRNLSLPEWTKKVMGAGSEFEYLAHYWFILPSATTELKRLKSGFLLKEILDRFKKKTLSLLPDQLMQIYSGHDYTIISILNSLEVFEFHVPPFSSSVLFELYESGNSHYVQIFYRNSTAEPLTPLNIPNCGTKCSLDLFYELYNTILPSDPETECRLSNE